MADDNVLIHALDACWSRMRKEWERTEYKYSEAAVHDLRVASRRLMAVLDTLRDLVDEPEIQECRRRVKKSLDALSPLRDVHVQYQRISTLFRTCPQLKTFRKKLSDKRARNVKKVQKLLKRGPKLGSFIAKARRRAKNRIDDSDIPGIVDQRYNEVVRLAKLIDRSDTATIHRTRLAFKRFRYTVEVVRPLFKNAATKSFLKELQAFQGLMGDIQDAEILSGRLAKWAAKEQKRSEELRPVLEEIQRQKVQSVDRFMESINKLYSFWGSTSSIQHT